MYIRVSDLALKEVGSALAIQIQLLTYSRRDWPQLCEVGADLRERRPRIGDLLRHCGRLGGQFLHYFRDQARARRAVEPADQLKGLLVVGGCRY